MVSLLTTLPTLMVFIGLSVSSHPSGIVCDDIEGPRRVSRHDIGSIALLFSTFCDGVIQRYQHRGRARAADVARSTGLVMEQVQMAHRTWSTCHGRGLICAVAGCALHCRYLCLGRSTGSRLSNGETACGGRGLRAVYPQACCIWCVTTACVDLDVGSAGSRCRRQRSWRSKPRACRASRLPEQRRTRPWIHVCFAARDCGCSDAADPAGLAADGDRFSLPGCSA